MQLKRTVYGEPPKAFLAIPDHYVAVTGIYQASKGEVLKAGTVVAIADDGTVTLPDGTAKFANGIVFNDTDASNETGGEKVNVTVLIHGFVRPSRLIKGKGNTASDAKTSMKTELIAFVE